MNIQTLTLGPLATNCYLVRADESSRAVIIDPAANSKRLLAALEEQGLTLTISARLKTCARRRTPACISARPIRTTPAVCATIC